MTTDFSEGSRKVLEYAFDAKDHFGCELYLLHVIETGAAIGFGLRQGHYTNAVSKMQEWAENQLLNLTPQKYVKDPGVYRMVRVGAAAEVISSVAADLEVDMVIVGTHTHGFAYQHMIGSTAEKILRRIDMPVLAIKG